MLNAGLQFERIHRRTVLGRIWLELVLGGAAVRIGSWIQAAGSAVWGMAIGKTIVFRAGPPRIALG